jgi:hypothetical protein
MEVGQGPNWGCKDKEKNPEGQRPFQRPGHRYVDRKMILKWYLKKKDGNVDSIHMAEDIHQWWALVIFG